MTCPRLCRNLVQLVGTVLMLLSDSGRFLGLVCTLAHRASRGESLPASTIGIVSRTPRQTSACHRCYPAHPGLARALVRLAPSVSRSATRLCSAEIDLSASSQ